ncbi:ChaN family lipoprotein [Thalassotalea aquiviva]|uniref:ChaN family lipoprotein n=1 Tax=Thalassotalea aquiviva TaxID=3242415 RepID=UPI00352A13EA
MKHKKMIAVALGAQLMLSACTTLSLAPSSSLQSLYDYQLIDSQSRASVSVAQTAKALADQDVIFIGEHHTHPGAHLLQMQLFQALYQQNPNLVLSLEQFSRPHQSVLNGYLNAKYGEETLIKEGEAWENYKSSYRPLVEFAKDHNLPVIAANAPIMHVRCVGQQGIEVLNKIPQEQRAWSSQKLNLEIKKYKDKFFQFLQDAGSKHGQLSEKQQQRMQNTYAAQLLRDTTMAESIQQAIVANPKAQIVHLNGSFHSDAHLGTVAVLEHIMPELSVSVISPVFIENADLHTIKQQDFAQGEYLLALKPLPPRYLDEQKEQVAVSALIKKRMAEKCEF